MNCKEVKELLPLYAGRDLEEKCAELVKAHVAFCAECATLADDYHEARQLLQKFAPPAFSEAVYNGIRQRVLREIGRESTEPALPQLVASLFRPRIRWAIATALMLAVAVFAFYFIADQGSNQQELAGNGAVDQTNRSGQWDARSRGNQLAVAPSPSSTPNNGPPFKSMGRSNGVNTTLAGSDSHTNPPTRRRSLGVGVDRQTAVAVNTPDAQPMTAKASPKDNNLAEPNAAPATGPAASKKTLRVEMQTKDPNIRIIWFSHQRIQQDSRSSKGI